MSRMYESVLDVIAAKRKAVREARTAKAALAAATARAEKAEAENVEWRKKATTYAAELKALFGDCELVCGNGRNHGFTTYGRCLFCEIENANASRDHLRNRLQTIQHSARQASITGNDWQREIKLIKNICDATLAEVTP